MSDAAAGSSTRIQECPRCGVSLDVSAAAPGTWLGCPGCQSPILVRARPVARVVPQALPPELEDTAWAPDPRLDDSPPPSPPSPISIATTTTAAAAPFEPRASSARRASRRGGGAAIAILAIFAGAAQVTFVGTFLGPQGANVIVLSWGFGFAMALFVSALTRSIMGRRAERDR